MMSMSRTFPNVVEPSRSSLRIHSVHHVGLVLSGVMTRPPLTANAGATQRVLRSTPMEREHLKWEDYLLRSAQEAAIHAGSES